MTNLVLSTFLFFSAMDIEHLNMGLMNTAYPELATWSSVEPSEYRQLGFRNNVVGNLWEDSISFNYAVDAYTDTLWRMDSLQPILIGQFREERFPNNWVNMDVSRINGFAINNGIGWLATGEGENGFGSRLFSINLSTAQGTYVGTIGDWQSQIWVNGMESVPESTIFMLFMLGLIGWNVFRKNTT